MVHVALHTIVTGAGRAVRQLRAMALDAQLAIGNHYPLVDGLRILHVVRLGKSRGVAIAAGKPAMRGVIEPGMVETEFTIVRTGGDKAASDALYADMDPMTADDIAGTIWWVATLPPHVNINTLELMPTNQSWAGFAVHRNEG